MARKSGISGAGLVLALIGGVLFLVYGVLRILSGVVTEANNFLNQLYDTNFISGSTSNGYVIAGIVAIVFGIIIIWVWKESKVRTADDALLWGIVFVILGIIGGGLPGVLVLLGGVLLILDYFL